MLRTTLLGLSLLLALPVYAQSPFGLAERLTIDASPAFPAAGESVFLTVRSTTLDLDRTDIAWYANDTPIASGESQRGVTVTLGALGSRTDVLVTVTTEDGESFISERTLRPTEVDLLWEGTSYAHPFYQGRRLAGSGSSVRVEALARLVRADGTTVPSRDTVYTWSRNDGVVEDISGRGKSAAVIPAPLLFGEDTVSVEAASLDGTLIAASSVRISSVDPFVALYQDHPLFGILYNTSVDAALALPDIEATFAAVPYFASVLHPSDANLRYSWRVNGVAIAPNPEDPSRLTINAENSDGAARVELSLAHATDYVMDARGAWNLLFGGGFGGAGVDLFGVPQ